MHGKALQTRRLTQRQAQKMGAAIFGATLCLTPLALAQPTQTVDRTVNTAGQTVNTVAGQLPGTVSSVGNTANNLVGGLQPTLQPVGQGVGNALNNLTQPNNISALLEFLSSVIPNHIEAHVNLDALRVQQLTVDIRGVDLRNLRVDLLVANSRNAGQVRPALQRGGQGGPGSYNMGGPGSTGGAPLPPLDRGIAGSSSTTPDFGAPPPASPRR